MPQEGHISIDKLEGFKLEHLYLYDDLNRPSAPTQQKSLLHASSFRISEGISFCIYQKEKLVAFGHENPEAWDECNEEQAQNIL
jgi:hypothetical protein